MWETCHALVLARRGVLLYFRIHSLFEGRHKFRKHYYKVIGDMKADGEEFQCAQWLDNHPKVKRWVRNLEGRPKHSFWLQTPPIASIPISSAN